MAETVSYGSYTFPPPAPFIGQGGQTLSVKGGADHFLDEISVVGTLTGLNLSGLYLQKMLMISGMLSEFQTLSVTNDAATKEFVSARPVDISFDSSDLTTVLPYSVSFQSYSSGAFTEFLGVSDPADNWSFAEQEGRITQATHTVSANGIKVNSTSALVNARHFVTGRTTGFADLSLFQTGVGEVCPFLVSRTEDINKFASSYGLTEVYDYSTSPNPISNSGIVTTSTSISYDKEGGVNVSVGGRIYGSIDSNITGGLLNTGHFTPTQAQDVAINAVVSSLSDYESGAYTFIDRGPTTYNYTLNTGSNSIDFSFEFRNNDNVDQIGDVLHTRSASVSASKDKANIDISVNGELKYNAPFDILGTGDPAIGARFKKVDAAFSGVVSGSGFLNFAVEALQCFREDATGYHISGDYVNPAPTSKQITKNPVEALVSYSVGFNNKLDLSSGQLSGLTVNISDKRPIELSGIVPSIGGFAKQKIMNRSLGEYTISASCEEPTGQMDTLERVVSGYLTGVFDISKGESDSDTQISFNWGRFY
tara:strand:+ start:41 stop:1648 length:1608 start_codon:yes stop_codon:yes gene_type:complete